LLQTTSVLSVRTRALAGPSDASILSAGLSLPAGSYLTPDRSPARLRDIQARAAFPGGARQTTANELENKMAAVKTVTADNPQRSGRNKIVVFTLTISVTS